MKFYIISGSMLGTAEYAATEISNYCNQQAIAHSLLHAPTLEQIADATHLVVVCSTHGEGDYPDNFQPLVDAIADADQPFSSGLKLLLVGIGSRDYDTFCNAISKFSDLMASKGFEPVVASLKIDVSDYNNDPEDLSREYFIANQDAFLA